MRRTVAGVLALTLALLACVSDDHGGGGAANGLSATTLSTVEPAPATDRATPDPPSTDAPAPTEPPATDAAGTSYAEAAGLSTITLLPTEGGEQPVLAWVPVDGAASYRLVALTFDKSPYWAWLGETTEVRFGGAPEAGGQTAIVFEPMTWRVIALDADGLPIAASEVGELTP